MTKVIMQSGRVYIVEEYDEKVYKNGWIYFMDDSDDTILGLRKDAVEAEVWQSDRYEQTHINENR